MHQIRPHDETQRIQGIPKLHSRRLRIVALVLLVLCLGVLPLGWRATRGHRFVPAFKPRQIAPWAAPGGIRPQSGVVLQVATGSRVLAWVDLEGSVHAESVLGRAFSPLLGVMGTSGALLAYDLNADGYEDLVFATSDRQLLAFDGKRGTRLAAGEWFTEPILGAPVLCKAVDGHSRLAVHSAAGKVAFYDAHTLVVVGHETYHRNRTRGVGSASDVNGDGLEDFVIGDESGMLLWLDAQGGALSEIRPHDSASQFSKGVDSGRAVRSSICNYDFTGDGRSEWVYCVQSGSLCVCDTRGNILADWQGPPVDTMAVVRMPSPVLADLNRDGVPEIIVAHPAGSVYAFQAPHEAVGRLSLLWKANIVDTIKDEVALADLTGDEVSDVVVVTKAGALYVLDGANGRCLYTWAVGADGSPLIDDLNGDGLLELIAPADSVWAVVETGATSFPGNEWSTWRGDAGRRGQRMLPKAPPAYLWWILSGALFMSSALFWIKS